MEFIDWLVDWLIDKCFMPFLQYFSYQKQKKDRFREKNVNKTEKSTKQT